MGLSDCDCPDCDPCSTCAYLRKQIESLESLIAEKDKALKFIFDRENLTFAECSDAEEIISVAKKAYALASTSSSQKAGEELCNYCSLPKKYHTTSSSKYSPAGHWTECYLKVLIVNNPALQSPPEKGEGKAAAKENQHGT